MMLARTEKTNVRNRNKRTDSILDTVKKDFVLNKYIYIIALPGILYYIIFHYVPMYGATIAFKDYNPVAGIFGSPWIGFDHFISFFNSYYFKRLLTNTVLLNLYELFWGFPAPILLALLLNELRSDLYKRAVQTVSYLPHFISLVVICGIIKDFSSMDGIATQIVAFFGGQNTNLLLRSELFRTIYISTDIWQSVGWGSIIYIAALSSIDTQLYDAATIDGAGRFRKIWNVTLPGIAPTIVILLILRMGTMMNIGVEKIILLYNPSIYDTADVITTFVYRKGLEEASYSYSAAVGLFNSVINFFLIIFANRLSRKVNETSLW